MNPYLDFSPVTLSYVAALRGVRPRQPGDDSFTYAEINCTDVSRLVCLAASNPEGRFYGIVAQAAQKADGQKLAEERQVTNVTFIDGKPEDILAGLQRGAASLPPLNYMCCDERQAALSPSARNACYALAEKLLLPGGLFGFGYRGYDKDDALGFLIRAATPEMDASQAKEFLQEIKDLGPHYFGERPALAAKLEQALKAGIPDQFFAEYDSGEARCVTLDAVVALRPRGFTYMGDSNIGLNYVERAAPASAHKLIADCAESPLYEPIKDFALNRPQRCDIWCRQPAAMSENLAELFGSFVYGITRAREEVPQQIKTGGQTIDLSAPLFSKLIDLMLLLPLSVGDFLNHPDGKNFSPTEVVLAMQILVAYGIARPMRGHYRSENGGNITQPRLVGAFNQYLDKTTVTGVKIWLSSPMAGSAVSVTAREALVLQALNRAGLANSVSALLPELERLAKDPAAAARVFDTATPTEEIATNMIKDTVSQSILQWYAYGLLAAA